MLKAARGCWSSCLQAFWGGCVGGNLAFPAVASHRKVGEALAPLAPTTSGVFHGAQSLGATSFLRPHVLPAGARASNKKVARPPAEMSFKYFLSRVALMKISMFNFLTGRVQPIGHSRGRLPVLLAGSALPRFPLCCSWEGPRAWQGHGEHSETTLLNFH